MEQILTIDQAAMLTEDLHKKGKKIVLTGGCFDILHPGHFSLLENAKKIGDVLFVLLESDAKIRELKGKNRPIHSQRERALMLLHLRSVDYIILLPVLRNDNDYDLLLKKIRPDFIATTENDKTVEHKNRQATLIGAKVVAVTKYIPHTSTSRLIDILSNEN